MICRTRARCGPVEFAVRHGNRQIVDRSDAPAHEPTLVELPVLVAVRAEPVVRVVVPFVGETHGDAITAEGPQLLDEPVVQLLRPFAREERSYCRPALQKLGAI